MRYRQLAAAGAAGRDAQRQQVLADVASADLARRVRQDAAGRPVDVLGQQRRVAGDADHLALVDHPPGV